MQKQNFGFQKPNSLVLFYQIGLKITEPILTMNQKIVLKFIFKMTET